MNSRYKYWRDPVLAEVILFAIFVSDLRLLWRVERKTARSQSVLNQMACRNQFQDKRAIRGQRVCVSALAQLLRGDYVQVSRALTDIHQVLCERLTLI